MSVVVKLFLKTAPFQMPSPVRTHRAKATNQINVDGKDRTPRCYTGDKKQTIIKSDTNTNRTSARLNFFTGKGNKKKYLGVVLK